MSTPTRPVAPSPAPTTAPSAPIDPPVARSRLGRFGRLGRRYATAGALQRLAALSVAANVAIVVTGGAVRLTNSGLGCPTWPSCTSGSLTPTRQYAIHGLIEFSNRMLTVVLVLVAVATWAVAMLRRRQRGLATLALLGIPAQAVLGGLTVLTKLNPWLVAAHFLLSMVIVAVTFLLWWRLRDPAPTEDLPPVHPLARRLADLTLLVTAGTLTIGTVVTGSGPHAGDLAENGALHRTGLRVASVAQLHADVVMVLIGLTVGLVVVVRAVAAGTALRRATAALLGVELGQAVIGYTQYFLHVPPLLVGLHMLGACLVWLSALAVVFRARAVPAALPVTAAA